MLPHSLTNFEIWKYYQNKLTFNGVYSRKKLPKIKDGAYVINLDQYKSIGTYLIAFYINGDNGSTYYNAKYFDSFGVKYIQKKLRNEQETKILSQIFIEYKHTKQYSVSTFVLDLFVLC